MHDPAKYHILRICAKSTKNRYFRIQSVHFCRHDYHHVWYDTDKLKAHIIKISLVMYIILEDLRIPPFTYGWLTHGLVLYLLQ